MIASANWSQDENPTTVAGPLFSANQRWHAIDTVAGRQAQLNELWQRVVDESNPRTRLVKLGQYLHYAQDMYAHQPYGGTWIGRQIGHGLPSLLGQAPDDLFSNPPWRVRGMVQTTVKSLVAANTMWTPSRADNRNANQQVKRVMAEVDPLLPRLTERPTGIDAVSQNEGRIETFLERPVPEFKLIRFDRNGDVERRRAPRRDDRTTAPPPPPPPPGGRGGAGLVLSPALGGVDFSSVELRFISEPPATRGRAVAYAFRGFTGKKGRAPARRAAGRPLDAFFVWLALPPSAFWVNLNPSEPDRIIDSELGRTDAGRIMLEADLRMKKTVARLIHPDTRSGRAFWDSLYDVGERQGFAQNCFSSRQWIVPGRVRVWEDGDSLLIVEARLDVKMESEYMRERRLGLDACSLTSPGQQKHAERLFRRTILPRVVRRVNTGPEYAELRSIFTSRIAAEWYRSRGTGGLYARIANSGSARKWYRRGRWTPRRVFNRYVESVTRGEFNVTRHSVRGNFIVFRTYFYGGVDFTGLRWKRTSLDALGPRKAQLNRRLVKAFVAPTGYRARGERWFAGIERAGGRQRP